MAALAATSSATPSLQSALLRTRLQQARREADQAEANAEDLRSQAEEQDRIVQQAHQRTQKLEKQAQTASIVAQTSTSQTTTQLQNMPTYEKAVAGVFQLGKPILAIDLSSTQKNVVKSSLFTLAADAWTRDASPSSARESHTKYVTTSNDSITGRVLNTSA
jgi:hypothetical protein